MLMFYVTDHLHLNAEKVDETSHIIHLSNGKTISVQQNVVHNGRIWEWKIGDQLFSKEEYALKYLQRLITEKLTGVRIIFHAKRAAPVICGVDGRACRCPGKCNTNLCMDCPVAEKFFADRDGVELIYAV